MENTALDKLKYPIGKYQPIADVNEVQLKAWIKALEQFPKKLSQLANSLTNFQLDTPYRPEGWTCRQVIHHLADSHANAYIRVKLALTEENPTVRPYFEERWAETVDAKHGDISYSLTFLEGIHGRLTACLKTLSLHDFSRTYFHPEHQQSFDLKHLLGTYVWHGEHHYMQIQSTLS